MDDVFDRMLDAPEVDSRKRKRADNFDDEAGPALPPSAMQDSGQSAQDIEQMLEDADANEVDSLDHTGLKSMLLSFEKKVSKNQMLRVKYADEPAKFMESEIELSEEIDRLKVIAAAPEMYPVMVSLGAVATILGLLTHENTDVSIAAIGLINDLTDADTLTEAEEAMTLVESMLENQALELLVQNLARLDEAEEEDAQGVYNTMAVFENLLEVKVSVAALLCEKTQILQFLLKRLRVKKFDANKLYASEVLSILLTSDTDNQRRLGTLSGMDGLDTLLQVVAHYRRRDPASAEEEECVENVFSCLSTALLVPENQARFRNSEGFELMLRCMKVRASHPFPALLPTRAHTHSQTHMRTRARACMHTHTHTHMHAHTHTHTHTHTHMHAHTHTHTHNTHAHTEMHTH